MASPKTGLVPHGKDLVLLAEIAPLLGLSPATLFQAGCRGELPLCRIGNRWACDLSEVQAFAKARADTASAAEPDPRKVQAIAKARGVAETE